MESSQRDSEELSANGLDSNISNTIQSSDTKKGRKRKKVLKVEKLGQNDEYDESLLKRRKKKLQGKGITLAVPKKALTAYAIFVKQKRRELQDCQDFNVKSPDMMKQLGKIWSNLSREERKTYEDVAKKDKERYEKEMNLLAVNGRTVEKLHEVEHKRPKKCLSAYMIFVRETRSKISKANPDMPVLQIMKEVGNKWQNLTPTEKQIFQKMADDDKIRYKEELKEFEKEVEKLQVVKPSKGKSNTKGKKKPAEVRNEGNYDTQDTIKNKVKTPEPEVIEIEDPPRVVPTKINVPEVKQPTKIDFYPTFHSEYSKVFRQYNPGMSEADLNAKISEKWAKLAEPDKFRFQNNPSLVGNFARREVSQLMEEAKAKPPTPPLNVVRDDNLIKRPMNIVKQDNLPTLPKLSATNVQREPMPYQMRYQMRPESAFQKQGNEYESVMLSANYNMAEE